MSQSGQSQNHYIQDLKDNYAASEAKLKTDIDALRSNLLAEQKAKSELATQLSCKQIVMIESANAMLGLKAKLQAELQKNNSLEEHLSAKQAELEGVRVNLEKAFENLVRSLSNIA